MEILRTPSPLPNRYQLKALDNYLHSGALILVSSIYFHYGSSSSFYDYDLAFINFVSSHYDHTISQVNQ